MNAVIYARYSSSAQTEQSIEGQMRVCKEYAKKNGYEVIGEYVDKAMTGTNANRPEFLKMISDAENKALDAIIVYKLDRFARNRYDSVVYKHKLKQLGIKVDSAMESISDSMEGKLVEGLLEMMAEMYSHDLRQKVIRGMKESFYKQQFHGETLLFGYKVIDKKIFVNEEVLPAVKYIFERYALGDFPNDIAEHLNNNGYRTYNGGKFFAKHFYTMLRNKKYIGIYEYFDEVCYKTYPALVDKELFNKVQERLKLNTGKRKRNKKMNYMLSGKTYCGICGSKMTGYSGTGRSKNKYYYYQCNNKRTKKYLINGKPCTKKMEDKYYLEDRCLSELSNEILVEAKIENLADKVFNMNNDDSLKKDITRLSKKIKNTQVKINNIVDLYIQALKNKTLLESLEQKHNYLIVEKNDYEQELKKLQFLSNDSFAKSKKETLAELKLLYVMTLNSEQEKEEFIFKFVNSIFVFEDFIVIYYNLNPNTKVVTREEMLESISNAEPLNNEIIIEKGSIKKNSNRNGLSKTECGTPRGI